MHKQTIIIAIVVVTFFGLASESIVHAEDDPESLKELAKARAAIARRQIDQIERSLFDPPSLLGSVRQPGRIDLEAFSAWSRRLMEAQIDLADTPADRDAGIRAHIDRLEKWLRATKELLQGEVAGVSPSDIDKLEYEVLEAKTLLIMRRSGATGGPAGGR